MDKNGFINELILLNDLILNLKKTKYPSGLPEMVKMETVDNCLFLGALFFITIFIYLIYNYV